MKDPAFLFYSSDFLNGVSDLTMEERGQFITLLCLQHQKGELTEKTIRLSVGSVSVDVMDKFSLTENKTYVNTRLKSEIEKRAAYTDSRRVNGQKGGRPSLNKEKKENNNQKENINKACGKPYGYYMDNHMENENINENINEIEIEKGMQGEKQIYGKTPKFIDPTEAQFCPDQQPELFSLISKNTQTPKTEIPTRFERYRLKCLTTDTYRSLDQHRAAFTSYCLSWQANERKTPQQSNKQAKKELIEQTNSKLEQLAASYFN